LAEKGYLNTTRALKHAKVDGDLKPLGASMDFQELFQVVEAEVK
jgi:hypothetical protein